jgi:cell division protein FtsL
MKRLSRVVLFLLIGFFASSCAAIYAVSTNRQLTACRPHKPLKQGKRLRLTLV